MPPLKPRPCAQCHAPFVPTYAKGRFCSRRCVGQARSDDFARIREGKRCDEPRCDLPPKRRGGGKPGYRRFCSQHERDRWPENPESRRASWRAKNHRRRMRTRAAFDEVTPEYERMLRAKARRCPLCKVKLTDTPYVPASKELDHIVPRIMGGTHTVGNVRIICRTCNLTRPKDGSDYAGPVTLWAVGEVA